MTSLALPSLLHPAWAWALLLGIGLNVVCGEPGRWHSLVLFDRAARGAARRRAAGDSSHGAGLVAGMLLLLAPPAAVLVLRHWWPAGWRWLFEGFVLYLAVGPRGLHEQVAQVGAALVRDDLPAARQAIQHLLGHEALAPDAMPVADAAVAGTLAQGHERILAPLFWFALAGGAGALTYRLVRRLHGAWQAGGAGADPVGRMAARLAYALDWVPARLSAASYAVLGDIRAARWCWQHQAGPRGGPGPIVAAGAGALGLRLGVSGGAAPRSIAGVGRPPQPRDVARALALVASAMLLWLVVLGLLHLVATR